nr:tetratricopeptide repeat protein [Snodgrassella alvi]
MDAQLDLGKKYFSGNGVKQSYLTAIEYFQQAATQDDAEAQFILGVMHLNGIGVKPNKRMAMELLRKSCENGKQKACELYRQLK